MITKSVLKSYYTRKCPHLVYLMLDEGRLLEFFKEIIAAKINPMELFMESDDEFSVEDISSPFEYLRDYPFALEKAKKLYLEKLTDDRVTNFIKENQDLNQTSRLSMRYFELVYGKCKRADTVDHSLNGKPILDQTLIEANTIKLMNDKNVNVILEGQIKVGHLRARYDALVRNGDGFDLYEVKGSRIFADEKREHSFSIKRPFLLDLGFQYRVYKDAGLPLKSINFLGVNSQFERISEVYPLSDEEITSYFVPTKQIMYNKTDIVPLKDYYDEKLYITSRSKRDFEDDIEELIALDKLGKDYEPVCKYECRSGGACELISTCFKNVDAYHTLKLTCNGGACGNWTYSKRIIDEEGILDIRDIPDSLVKELYPLTKPSKEVDEEKNPKFMKRSVARMQVDFAQGKFQHKHIIEMSGIHQLLQDYKGKTLIFFDFESFQYAFPLVKICHPWQQICSQYSMHICKPDYELNKHDFAKGEGGGIKHYEFLGDPYVDRFTSPETHLLETLMNQLNEAGINYKDNNYVVIVYNISFENTRFKEMGERYGKYHDFCETFRAHIVDLYYFFIRGYWYHQDFGNSLSLKTTQPTFMHDETILNWYKDFPGGIAGLQDTLNYKKGIIKNGAIALDIYQTLLRQALVGEKHVLYDEFRQALLAYCKIDSWGTVILYDTIVKAYDKIKDGSIDLDIDINNQVL